MCIRDSHDLTESYKLTCDSEQLITDKATKEPLIGAAVQLSGTNIGTITDVDGNFEPAGLRNGTYKLIISYVSYCTQTVEVTINGMFEIKVELEQDLSLIHI